MALSQDTKAKTLWILHGEHVKESLPETPQTIEADKFLPGSVQVIDEAVASLGGHRLRRKDIFENLVNAIAYGSREQFMIVWQAVCGDCVLRGTLKLLYIALVRGLSFRQLLINDGSLTIQQQMQHRHHLRVVMGHVIICSEIGVGRKNWQLLEQRRKLGKFSWSWK